MFEIEQFIYKNGLGINNLQWVMCYKTNEIKQNKTKWLLLLLLLSLFTPLEIFISVLADGFSMESDWQSPQVSRTRLRILAVLSNAVIWIVSTRPPTSKSSRSFNNPLVIVPKAPITTGTIVTLMFHTFLNYLARSRYLSFFAHAFRFILWFTGTAKSAILQILFF